MLQFVLTTLGLLTLSAQPDMVLQPGLEARLLSALRPVTEEVPPTWELLGIEVPKDRSTDAMTDGIPVTYVPARNTIFLSYALAWAEVLGAYDIFCGVNAVDYSGYPDCRPEFVRAFEAMANLAIAATVEGKGKITIHAPLIELTKAEIIEEGIKLGVDYGLTHSCYDPVGQGACGRCDSCLLRKAGFESAGIPDPTRYAD